MSKMKHDFPQRSRTPFVTLAAAVIGFMAFGLLGSAVALDGSKAAMDAHDCEQNMKAVGTALALYVGDCDDRFPYFSHVSDLSRSEVQPMGGRLMDQWYVMIDPYLMSNKLLRCPSHYVIKQPSRELTSRANLGYHLNRVVEGLEVSQIEKTSEIAMLTEAAAPGKKSWFEPPRDLIWDSNKVLGVGKHEAGVFSVSVDSSFHVIPPKLLEKDPCGLPWSGVDLMRKYPIPEVKGRPSLFTKKCPK